MSAPYLDVYPCALDRSHPSSPVVVGNVVVMFQPVNQRPRHNSTLIHRNQHHPHLLHHRSRNRLTTEKARVKARAKVRAKEKEEFITTMITTAREKEACMDMVKERAV